jgi:hypothetical protein
MKTPQMLLTAALALLVAAPALPNVAPDSSITVIASADMAERDRSDREDRDKEAKEARVEREESMYDSASDMLDDHEWRKAAETFDRVAQMRMSHADAALYWLAYAQAKMGQRSESLATLVNLQKQYPKSRWVEDGKALEVEIRQGAGQTIDAGKVEDEDLKLMALSGLMASDAEHALPILEGILTGHSTQKVKERALFVLSQSQSPRALEVLSRTARTNGELQNKAVRYLGIMGGERSRQVLADVYSSTSDVDLKKSILRSFMVSGDRGRLLNIARSETNIELRGDAISQLGVSGARTELAEMYSSEPSIELRKKIIQAMFIGGNAEKLGEIARTEKTPELRVTAIRNLGLLGGSKSGQLLLSIYQTDGDAEVKRAVINGLFLQNNGAVLVQLARGEKDRELKKSIISKLAIMHSKEASDYLMEVLRD